MRYLTEQALSSPRVRVDRNGSQLSIDEECQLFERSIAEARARFVAVASDQPRHGMSPSLVVDQQDALAGRARPAEDVAYFEADTVTGSRRLSDQHIALRQPFEIAAVDLLLCQ